MLFVCSPAIYSDIALVVVWVEAGVLLYDKRMLHVIVTMCLECGTLGEPFFKSTIRLAQLK